MTQPSRIPIALFAACAVWILPGGAHAQGAGSLAAGSASGKEYVLARKSSFDAPTAAGQRNPFWPIGWTPSAAAPTAAPILDVQADAFRITSTSVDYPALAVINGRTYGIGEQVPVAGHPGQFVTVRQILDDVVMLDYQGHALRAMSGATPRSAR